MDYTRKGDCITVGQWWVDDYYTDVNGTVYDGNNVICQGSWSSSGDEQYVIYSLNSEYSSFTGTIFRTYASLRREGSSWTWYSDVKIYGDGILLYECTDITRETEDAIDFEIDVTGVRELKIEVTGVARCYSSFANDWDTCVILGLGNLILSK